MARYGMVHNVIYIMIRDAVQYDLMLSLVIKWYNVVRHGMRLRHVLGIDMDIQ